MKLVSVFNILTFIVLLRYSIKSIYRISKQRESLANFTLLFIVFFNGIPLILDAIFGLPKYGGTYIGFNLAIEHIPSSIIYNFYMIFVCFILNRYSIKRNKIEDKFIGIESSYGTKQVKTMQDILLEFLAVIIILLPLFHVITSPYLLRFLVYGSAGMRGIADSTFNELNAMLRMFSLAIMSVWILGKKKQGGFAETIMFLVFSIILIWIDGKRYIIAFIAVIAFYALWKRGKLKGKKIIVYVGAGLLILLTISVYYQINMRSSFVDYSEFDNIYRSYRMDFSRDAVIKLAIYSEITSFPRILNYRGQSFLALILMYIPRTIWANKPYQYTRYITASIFQISPDNVTWGITYSIFDQSIANLGLFFGMPFAIIFLLKLIKLADKSSSDTTKLLSLLIIISSLTMNLAYIAPIILVLICKMLYIKFLRSYSRNS